MTLELIILALLAPRSANWANGPLIQMYAKYIVFKQWMYANYLKIESYPHKKRNLVRMSLELMTLALLAPRSANWANGPLIQMYAKYIVFKQWMYANYLKIESYPHKKRNLVRMSLELMTLALLAPRSANWANGPLIQMYAKYIVFKQWMYANYLKIESYPHKKRNLVRMSLELMTLALLAPRSANWANGPLIQMYAKYIVFKQWMYANYLKIESYPHKKRNLVRMSLELMTLALLAPRSANWANGPLIQMYAKYIVFKQWMYANYQKLSTQNEKSGPYEPRTHDLSVISTTLCQLS